MSERPLRAAGGRIVLDTFRSSADPMLAAWLFFRSQMLRGEKAQPSTPELIRSEDDRTRGVYGVWRLLATNNREIGRCAALYRTPGEAQAGALAAQREATSFAAAPVRGAQPLTHGWVLRAGETAVVISPRWYESASEAASAARTAGLVLAGSTLVEGVNIGTVSGRRHRRALVPDDAR